MDQDEDYWERVRRRKEIIEELSAEFWSGFSMDQVGPVDIQRPWVSPVSRPKLEFLRKNLARWEPILGGDIFALADAIGQRCPRELEKQIYELHVGRIKNKPPGGP
jgi:hypothetical protein